MQKKKGRPYIKNKPMTFELKTYITEDMHDELLKYSIAYDISISEVVRRAIDSLLKSEQSEKAS